MRTATKKPTARRSSDPTPGTAAWRAKYVPKLVLPDGSSFTVDGYVVTAEDFRCDHFHHELLDASLCYLNTMRSRPELEWVDIEPAMLCVNFKSEGDTFGTFTGMSWRQRHHDFVEYLDKMVEEDGLDAAIETVRGTLAQPTSGSRSWSPTVGIHVKQAHGAAIQKEIWSRMAPLLDAGKADMAKGLGREYIEASNDDFSFCTTLDKAPAYCRAFTKHVKAVEALRLAELSKTHRKAA